MRYIKPFNEMYTYDIFCYGHDLSKDPELVNDLNEYDIQFRTDVPIHGNKPIQVSSDTRRFELDFPYHGDMFDPPPCVCGIEITSSDGNKGFNKEVRGANESDYEESYQVFLERLFPHLDQYLQYGGGIENIIGRLRTFVEENDPEFYTVEASS